MPVSTAEESPFSQKVMLDRDLAELYQVETRRINEQVKRNISRFPEDFMFQLNADEFSNLISQFVTLNIKINSFDSQTSLPFQFPW
ncbi:MAG: ORF6N domain-containing protein [Bacteroidales bacterium]|nr:ORF6N domain-containing protein [Bacteroidales bacterium]